MVNDMKEDKEQYSISKMYWYIDDLGRKQHCRWLQELNEEQLSLSSSGYSHLVADQTGHVKTVKKLYSVEDLHPTMEVVVEHINQYNKTGLDADLGFIHLYFFDNEQLGEMFYRASQFDERKRDKFISVLSKYLRK